MTLELLPALAAMVEGIPYHPDAPCTAPGWLGHSDFAVERRKAASDCHACPIREACLEAAEERRERWGVWGGVDLETLYRAEHTSPAPRKRERARCGTESGYKAHKRLHAPACGPCKQAHAIHQSEWREARRTAS